MVDYKLGINVDGALAKLKKVENLSLQKIQQGVMQAADFVAGEVKQSVSGRREEPASVDTGDFMRSIHSIPTGFAQAKVTTELPYPIYLEEGTNRIKARKHFKNTKVRTKDRVQRIINDKIDEAVRSAR